MNESKQIYIALRFSRDVVFKAAFYEAASKAFPPEKIELSDGRLYLEIHGTTQENANSKNSTMLGSLFAIIGN